MFSSFGQIRPNGVKRPMPNPAWTAEEDTKLRELIATCTTQEMAEAIGRSRKGVKRRMIRLGLSPRWRICRGGLRAKIWHREDDLKLIGLSHLTQKEAARVMGVRLISVQRRIQSLGIKWRQGRKNPTSIAALMGIERNRVYHFTRKYGIGTGRGRKKGGCYNLTDDEVQIILEHFREGRLYLQREGLSI